MRDVESDELQSRKQFALVQGEGEARSVAATLLPSLHRKEDVEEFVTELRSVVTLRHENLVEVVGCVTATAPPMVLFEWLEETLKQALKAGRIGEGARLQAGVDVASGLEYLHSRCVVHRSLRAASCFVTAGGRVKIAGFRLTPRLQQEHVCFAAAAAVVAADWLRVVDAVHGSARGGGHDPVCGGGCVCWVWD